MNNCLTLPGQGIAMIRELTSLVNYDCKPNCSWYWRHLKHEGGEIVLVAGRDILAGEGFTYDSTSPTLSREMRRNILFATYNITCCCTLCTLPAPLAHKSDDRRAKMKSIEKSIQESQPRLLAEPKSKVAECYDPIQLTAEEHAGTPHLEKALVSIYKHIYMIQATHSDMARAKVFLERHYQAGLGTLKNSEETLEQMLDHGTALDCTERLRKTRKWEARLEDVPKGLNARKSGGWVWARK